MSARPLPESMPLAYSAAQIARALSVSRESVYRAMRRGELAFVFFGEKRVVLHDDLAAYLAAHRQKAVA